MFHLIVQFTNSVRSVLAYTPSHRIAWHLRTRGGPRSAFIAAAAGVAYLLAAVASAALLDDGGPGWLNALVLLFIWNAFKLILHGLTILLADARGRLAHRRSQQRAHHTR